MREAENITIISNRKRIVLCVSTILYVLMLDRKAEIHVTGGRVYQTKMPLSELEAQLGEGFLKVHRGCLVSVTAIHDIGDCIDLINGETLEYARRRKNEILGQLRAKRKNILHVADGDGVPATNEEYHAHYACFDALPFAFTDIEMVFDDERRAVDWIFRYGNPALAKLERIPLERLIGSSFGSLFSNMDTKWLRSYERATLYGETLELIDYSPEIDAYLKVLCFPTFPKHCGCILVNIEELKFDRSSSDAERAMILYFSKLLARGG